MGGNPFTQASCPCPGTPCTQGTQLRPLLLKSSPWTPSLPAPNEGCRAHRRGMRLMAFTEILCRDNYQLCSWNKFIFQVEAPARLCSSPAQWPHHMPFWFPLLISNFFFSGISSPGNKRVSRGSWRTLSSVDLHHTEQRQQMVILH